MKVVIIGALNWGLIGAFNFNLVEYLTKKINLKGSDKYIYIIVGLCALKVLLNRDMRLPFLGKTVFPCFSLTNTYPSNFTHITNIKVQPNSKVVYWAALEDNNQKYDNPWQAYGDYDNYGITVSDNNGNAQLRYKFPTQYKVPIKGLLHPHVHYRVCVNKGMMSPIYTINLK